MTPPIRTELDTMSDQPCLTSYYKEVIGVEIRILGMGCPNCERLQRNVFNAAAELGIDADILDTGTRGRRHGVG